MGSARASPELRRLLRDPTAAPRPTPDDHANALLRAHLLQRIARALTAEGTSALLVKGAALALTAYPDPAARAMGDIDLLVPRARRDRVVSALVRDGGVVRPPAGRPWSGEMLGETLVVMRAGVIPFLVEVHTSLDKVVARPIDERALLGRATAAPGLPGLLIPSPEDHAILIAIHAASHDFEHAVALLDTELLLRRGLDLDALAARARAYRAGTVMFILMRALRELGAASVTDAHVAAFDPGPLRRAVLDRRRARGGEDQALGVAWIVRQTPLRDDLGGWARGLVRYAALRGVERLLFAKA